MLIELTNNLSEIKRLTEELERFCDQEELPLKTGLELNLVLEELVTNIISYAYSDNSIRQIKISLEHRDNRVAVIIEDDGSSFNPLEAPEPDKSDNIDDLEPGGLGIHLALKLTDGAEYNRQEGRNILTLTKLVPSGT